MFEQFDLPVCNMPWLVKDILRDHRYGELIEISHHGYGTPDGEVDTDAWNMTFVNRDSGVVTFVSHIYKGHDCLALPAIEKISYWADWLDKGTQYTTKFNSDKTRTTSIEEVAIDNDLKRNMIYKMLNKRTLEMEVA